MQFILIETRYFFFPYIGQKKIYIFLLLPANFSRWIKYFRLFLQNLWNMVHKYGDCFSVLVSILFPVSTLFSKINFFFTNSFILMKSGYRWWVFQRLITWNINKLVFLPMVSKRWNWTVWLNYKFKNWTHLLIYEMIDIKRKLLWTSTLVSGIRYWSSKTLNRGGPAIANCCPLK